MIGPQMPDYALPESIQFFATCFSPHFPLSYRKDGMKVKKIKGLAQELATARKIPNFCSGEFWT